LARTSADEDAFSVGGGSTRGIGDDTRDGGAEVDETAAGSPGFGAPTAEHPRQRTQAAAKRTRGSTTPLVRHGRPDRATFLQKTGSRS
jgi:hypothetical protein